MVHLAFQIKDLYLEVLDELMNRINWCRIDPPSKTTVFWSIGRLQNKFHVRCLIEDKEEIEKRIAEVERRQAEEREADRERKRERACRAKEVVLEAIRKGKYPRCTQ